MKAAKVYDSLVNLLTGLGVPGMDKSTASRFVDVRLTYPEMEDAFSSDWLVNKVCSVPPFDMTREWRSFDGDIDSKKVQELEDFEEELKLRERFRDAMTWGRVYGGCGIIIIEKGKAPESELELDKIRKGGLDFIQVVDRQYLNPGEIDHDPVSKTYGYPKTYRIAGSKFQIHHSRVIRFEGVPLPLQARRRNQYWGKSVVEALYSALRRAAEVQESIGTLIHEATVDVVRIPELMEMIAHQETEQQLQKRFGVAKMQKSINRMLLLDKEEEYESHNQAFTGLNDLVEKFLSIVGGAADIPITRLLGQSPAGMNSTGESDIRNYYDHIRAKQEYEMRTALQLIDQVMYRHLFGTEPQRDELKFSFNSLWQMTDEEQANLENMLAQRDSQYLNDNIINEAIIARDLMERGVYSGIDAEYVTEMEKAMKPLEEELNQPPPQQPGQLPEEGQNPENPPENQSENM